MCFEGVPVDIGAIVVLGEDRLQNFDALGASGITAVIAVVVVMIVIVIVVMIVAVRGAVVVAVESTHTRNSSYVTSTEVTRNSSPRTTVTSALVHRGQATDHRDSISDCWPQPLH